MDNFGAPHRYRRKLSLPRRPLPCGTPGKGWQISAVAEVSPDQSAHARRYVGQCGLGHHGFHPRTD